MRNTWVCVVVFVGLMACGGNAESQRYSGPSSLGNYRIGTNVAVKTILEKLEISSPKKSGYNICVKFDSGESLLLEEKGENTRIAGGVLLSNFQNCIKGPINRTPVASENWKTKEGVRLGTRKQEILAIYGRPSRIDRVKGDMYRWIIAGDDIHGSFSKKNIENFGEEVLAYEESDTLFAALFGLHNGIVTWIYLKDGE